MIWLQDIEDIQGTPLSRVREQKIQKERNYAYDYFFKIHFNNILLSSPTSLKSYFPIRILREFLSSDSQGLDVKNIHGSDAIRTRDPNVKTAGSAIRVDMNHTSWMHLLRNEIHVSALSRAILQCWYPTRDSPAGASPPHPPPALLWFTEWSESRISRPSTLTNQATS